MNDAADQDKPLSNAADAEAPAAPKRRRTTAKAAKEWAVADGVRNRLKELGITLMDRPGGETTWERAEALPAGRS